MIKSLRHYYAIFNIKSFHENLFLKDSGSLQWYAAWKNLLYKMLLYDHPAHE